MAGLRLRASVVFPYRWLVDPEDRKFLGKNLAKLLRQGGLKEVMATSGNDAYYADFGDPMVTVYVVRLKYHAWQPVKIPMTQKQMETVLKEAFPYARCAGFEPFFVQASDKNILPTMELEVFY